MVEEIAVNAEEGGEVVALMADDNLSKNYEFNDDPALLEDHFDSKDFPSEATTSENMTPEIVYDGFDAIAPLQVVDISDGGMNEEVDVEEKANELLQEAKDDMSVLRDEEENNNSNTYSNPAADNRKAWMAHGTIGTIIFGLLVPSAISSAFFRDLIPGYWIYIHVALNVITFAMTFLTVGIAFFTMAGMGVASEGHMKEIHHIVGLLLLLLVSFQAANGFLRPPREFITDDEHDRTPGAIYRSNSKSLTTRTIWYLTHAGTGLFIFGLGAYQVYSGMGLFAKRFASTDWGSVYLGYIFWIILMITGGKIWMKLRERSSKRNVFEMQMHGEGSSFYEDDGSSGSGSGRLQFRSV